VNNEWDNVSKETVQAKLYLRTSTKRTIRTYILPHRLIKCDPSHKPYAYEQFKTWTLTNLVINRSKKFLLSTNIQPTDFKAGIMLVRCDLSIRGTIPGCLERIKNTNSGEHCGFIGLAIFKYRIKALPLHPTLGHLV
jgi:hypothetical protein